MKKKCSKLAKEVYKLTKDKPAKSDVSQINDLLEACVTKEGRKIE